jgi:excinuclease ABC subunit C
MKNDAIVKDFTESSIELYPHLKITNEEYPRVLATRRIDDDAAEYFGALLTKTAVRVLIGFINRKFQLRSCDIPIDGKFPVPCTQYYHRRCVAPCVESLCDRDSYLDVVDLVRLFLANRRNDLIEKLSGHMEAASEQLDFETAAHWRDLLKSLEKFWKNPRWNVWLDDSVDTYATDETEAGSFIYLVTQRNRYVLGRKVFELPRGGGQLPHEALPEIIRSFYRFYVPREIRVAFDFPERQALARELSSVSGRPLKIAVVKPDRQLITSTRAFRLAQAENDLDFAKQSATPRQISGELKRLFGLAHLPKRVEAFDVAHISGTAFVSANSVWTLEGFQPKEYMIRIGDQSDRSELTALANGVAARLALRVPGPDLILLDGGRSQLNAVINNWDANDHPNVRFVGAVKPPLKHASISHFLLESGEKISFDATNPVHHLLQRLRDEAHDLANRAHRDLRDMTHNYELAGILPSINEAERREILKLAGSIGKVVEMSDGEIFKNFRPQTARLIANDLKNYRNGNSRPVLPLIVPIRFDDDNGSADDLRPISSQ